MEFFSSDNIGLYIAIVLSVANGILMCFASYKFFQIIQLSGYRIKGYFRWLKDTKASYVSRMALLSLLSIFCVLVTNALFDAYHTETLYSYIGPSLHGTCPTDSSACRHGSCRARRPAGH